MVWKLRPFKVVLCLGNRKKYDGAKSGERVDWAQRMSDVLPGKCG